jgi:chemosensory pili system protein ChpA (sensor histidine kinase/response regulator)
LNAQGAEFVEIFLQEASERLQFLREYSGILQDAYPRPEDVERLYIAAHTLAGTSASYGFPLFAEISGKLAHIFQYAMNATIAADAAGPLVEFVSEAVALLESDLIMISTNAMESDEDIGIFKQRYPFAFQTSALPQQEERTQATAAENASPANADKSDSVLESSTPVETPYQPLPADGEVPAEVLEFFVPEVEEHLQIVTHCLLSLETNPSSEQIHRLLRAMHTVKGSAAQVGLHRISSVAHRAEDLIGRLREGELRPSAEIIDICLDAVDTLKKFLYHQWTDEAVMQTSVQGLFSRISRLVPPEREEEVATLKVAAVRDVAAPAPTQQIEAAPASYLQEIHLSDDEPAVASAAAIAHQEIPVAVPVLAPAVAAEIKKPEGIEKFADEDLMRKEPASMPQSKSVRVGLERLDRMMNAVGELVINRTRMLGRVAELERLADVLNFSKARMQDKVSEFQEKHEFSRIHSTPTPRPSDDFPLRSGYSSYSHSFDHSLAEFSELEMDRYDDFNILSRSLTEISADITEVLTQLDGFVRRVDGDIDEFTKLAHRLQDEITQARMVPIGNLYTRISRTVRDAAKAVNKKVELTLAGAETELDNNIIQQISDPLIHLVRNAVAHGLERDEERYAQGKSDSGNVAVRAYRC